MGGILLSLTLQAKSNILTFMNKSELTICLDQQLFTAQSETQLTFT